MVKGILDWDRVRVIFDDAIYNNTMQVKDFFYNDYQHTSYSSNSEEMKAICQHIPKHQLDNFDDITAIFTKQWNGEYVEIWVTETSGNALLNTCLYERVV